MLLLVTRDYGYRHYSIGAVGRSKSDWTKSKPKPSNLTIYFMPMLFTEHLKEICCSILPWASVATAIPIIALASLLVLTLTVINPTRSSVQYVRQNNTVLLHFNNMNALGHSFDPSDLQWYDSVVVESVFKDTIVKVVSVKGNVCAPPDNNTIRESFKLSSDIHIDAERPLVVDSGRYLTQTSQLSINISVQSSNETKFNDETTALSFIILDKMKDYDCFTSDTATNALDCNFLAKFPAHYGNGTSINFNFTESRYYFLLLLSNTAVRVQYSYELVYQFYNYTDYSVTSACTIDEDNDWKPCSTPLYQDTICVFAYSPPPEDVEPQFSDLGVTFNHKMSNWATLASAIVLIGVILAGVSIWIMILSIKFLHRKNT